jgi:CheY-like chemotaxis protein
MRKATILVIDDQPEIRGLLLRVLEGAGYTVLEAADGHSGIALHRRQPADLILTDLVMPQMGGLDTIMALVQEFLNVKVIAMSGAADSEGLLRTARLLGARRTLHKPFSMEQLLNAVRYELAH